MEHNVLIKTIYLYGRFEIERHEDTEIQSKNSSN